MGNLFKSFSNDLSSFLGIKTFDSGLDFLSMQTSVKVKRQTLKYKEIKHAIVLTSILVAQSIPKIDYNNINELMKMHRHYP